MHKDLFIDTFNNLNLKHTLIIAVSGGVDSMSLLHMTLKITHNLVCVFFDHQTRAQIKDEHDLVKNFCILHNVPFIDHTLFIKPSKNFQSEARNLRYKFLKEVAQKYQTPYILTGHHLNDLAEALEMRIQENSSRFLMSPIYETGGIILVKPLLYITKQELYQYASSHHVPFLEDASNQEVHYFRNKVRVLIKERLAKNPDYLKEIAQTHQENIKTYEIFKKEALTFINKDNQVNIHTVSSLDPRLQREIISNQLIKSNLVPKRTHIDHILSLFKTNKPNMLIHLTKHDFYYKSYELGYIHKLQSKNKLLMTLKEGKNLITPSLMITFLTDIDVNKACFDKLCYNKLEFPLTARHRMPGDLLQFDYGSKKLKDFLIDKKVPLLKRDELIVICDQNNTIVFVIDYYKNLQLGNQNTLYYHINRSNLK